MPRKPRFQHRKKNEREKRLLLQDQPQTPSVPVPVIVAQASSPEHSSSSSLHQLHASVVLPNRAWTDVSPEDLENIRVCKVTQASGSSSVQPQITHSLIVSSDMKWKLLVLEHDVSGSCCLHFQRDLHARPFQPCCPRLMVSIFAAGSLMRTL